MINWFIIKPQLGIGIVHFFSISISERYTVFFMASSERNESFDLVYFLIFSFKFSISKQLPHIHRKKIFRTDATITYNKCRLRIKKFAEFIQSFCSPHCFSPQWRPPNLSCAKRNPLQHPVHANRTLQSDARRLGLPNRHRYLIQRFVPMPCG